MMNYIPGVLGGGGHARGGFALKPFTSTKGPGDIQSVVGEMRHESTDEEKRIQVITPISDLNCTFI